MKSKIKHKKLICLTFLIVLILSFFVYSVKAEIIDVTRSKDGAITSYTKIEGIEQEEKVFGLESQVLYHNLETKITYHSFETNEEYWKYMNSDTDYSQQNPRDSTSENSKSSETKKGVLNVLKSWPAIKGNQLLLENWAEYKSLSMDINDAIGKYFDFFTIEGRASKLCNGWYFDSLGERPASFSYDSSNEIAAHIEGEKSPEKIVILYVCEEDKDCWDSPGGDQTYRCEDNLCISKEDGTKYLSDEKYLHKITFFLGARSFITDEAESFSVRVVYNHNKEDYVDLNHDGKYDYEKNIRASPDFSAMKTPFSLYRYLDVEKHNVCFFIPEVDARSLNPGTTKWLEKDSQGNLWLCNNFVTQKGLGTAWPTTWLFNSGEGPQWGGPGALPNSGQEYSTPNPNYDIKN